MKTKTISRRSQVLKRFNEDRDYMNSRIRTGIEENRMGFGKLHFVTDDGTPVDHVHVEIEQTSHDFGMGANLFMLDEMESAEKNAAYRQYFAEAFNLATLPFYWNAIEPEQDKPRYDIDSPDFYRRPNPERCLKFCGEHGIEPKVHCLVYENFLPEWLPPELDAVKKLYYKRMRELSERFADRIPSWEVTNETLVEWPRRRTPLARTPDMVEWAFKHADRYFPENKLIINECQQYVWTSFNDTRSQYYMQIENLLRQGVRIDTIGAQFHTYDRGRENEANFYDPVLLYEALDGYARFNLPMQITEMTIPCYSGEPEDEALQAELMENMLKIWFSHRSMESVVYWNLVDGYAHGAQPGDMRTGENVNYGGLIRFDLTPKPAFEVVKRLFQKEWHTTASLDSDNQSHLSFQGFYGNYSIKTTAGGRTRQSTLHLTKRGKREFKILI